MIERSSKKISTGGAGNWQGVSSKGIHVRKEMEW